MSNKIRTEHKEGRKEGRKKGRKEGRAEEYLLDENVGALDRLHDGIGRIEEGETREPEQEEEREEEARGSTNGPRLFQRPKKLAVIYMCLPPATACVDHQ